MLRQPKARPPRVPLPCDPVTRQHAPTRAPAWQRSPVHLAWVRTQPCMACGRSQHVAAAHVWRGADGAKGEKPSDLFTVPLCDGFLADWAFVGCHQVQHNTGEITFYRDRGVADPAAHAARSYAINSPCPSTRAAAKRWLETGHWQTQDTAA